jgi:uncharacterized membrane protein
LTEEQVAVLAASAEAAPRPQDSARAVMVFGVIGAVLTGLGAILFVAGNWAVMSPLQRTLMLLAGYGLAVAAASFAEGRRLPLVADALWLLATLVLGANIFLIAQTYNLTLTLWQGTLAWMIGALAMGYARQSAAQVVVAIPLGLLTLGWAGGGTGWFFDDQLEFLFADGGLRPLLPLLGLALVAASTLLVRRADVSFAATPCFRWGVFLVATTLIVTTAEVRLAAAFYDAELTAKQVLLMVTCMVVVAAATVAGKMESSMSRPMLAVLLGVLPAMMIPAGDSTWVGVDIHGVHVFFGLYVIGVFSIALLTIWLGIQARNARLINAGMLATTLIIIIQYFGWSFELLDRSVAFILGGIVLIALSVFVEKQRRRIMEQIAA